MTIPRPSHPAPRDPSALRALAQDRAGDAPAGESSLEAVLARNLARVRARLERACAAAGRTGPESEPPMLLPVTKSVAPAVALALAGLLARTAPATGAGRPPVELGENRADGLEAKAAAFEAASRPARWHFVGHLQRNKVQKVVRRAAVLHSLDSRELAESLAAAAERQGRRLDVYVQVHFTGEREKHGLDEAGARDVMRFVVGTGHLAPLGLMAMGPREPRGAVTTESVFARTAELARALERDPELADRLPRGRCGLSLGMSDDLEAAVAAGSTVVRIGSDLFADVSAGSEPDELEDSEEREGGR